MHERCAHCGDVGNLQAGLDAHQCLSCGLLTHSTGFPIPPDPQFVVLSPIEEAAKRDKELPWAS